LVSRIAAEMEEAASTNSEDVEDNLQMRIMIVLSSSAKVFSMSHTTSIMLGLNSDSAFLLEQNSDSAFLLEQNSADRILPANYAAAEFVQAMDNGSTPATPSSFVSWKLRVKGLYRIM
jgi:hypothetical protein